MIDGVLANVTVHMAGGDEGASAAIANGNANVTSGHSSPSTILVGGIDRDAVRRTRRPHPQDTH